MKSRWLLSVAPLIALIFTIPSTPPALLSGVFKIRTVEYDREASMALANGEMSRLADLVKRNAKDMIVNAATYGGTLEETIEAFVMDDWGRVNMSPNTHMILEPGGDIIAVNTARDIYARINEATIASMFGGQQPGGPPGGLNPAELMRRAMGNQDDEPTEIQYSDMPSETGCDKVTRAQVGDLDLSNWKPGTKSILAVACLSTNRELRDVVKSFMDRFSTFTAMGREEEDAEDKIEKKWLETGPSWWEKWIIVGGMYQPDVTAKYVTMEFQEQTLDSSLFEYSGTEVPPMQFFQSMQ